MNSWTRIRTTWITAAGLALAASSLFAVSQGRVVGTIVDENGEPVAGVSVTITSPEIDFNEQKTTNKKGQFKLMILDATRKYAIRFEKQGHQAREERLLLEVGGVVNQTWTLPSVGAAAVPTPARVEGETISPTDPAIPFNEGAEAARAGDMETAKAKFYEALERDPKLAPAHSALAGIFLSEKDYAKAVEHAEATLEREPQNVRAISIAYEAYDKLGQSDKAKEYFERLSELDRGGDAAVFVFNAGVEAARVGDLDGAIAKFKEALVMNPDLVQGHSALTIAYLRKGDYATAAREAELWVAGQPGEAKALQARYDAYRALGDAAKAKAAFDELVAADPSAVADSLFEQALKLFNDNQIDQARALVEKVIEAKPEHPKAHYILGLCLINQGDSKGAKEHLQHFVELAPNDPEAPTARDMIGVL